MRSVCRALLVLNVLYCMLALAQDGIPGWRMFEGVEDVRHELVDGAGASIDVREWLPRGANLVDRSELRQVVSFMCEKNRSRAPFTYRETATGVTATLDGQGPKGCKVHASR